MSLNRACFLSASGSFFAAAAGAPSYGFAAAANPSATPHPSASQILAELMQGNRRYIDGTTIHGDRTARRDELSGSQRPSAMILSCADSRVPPELIFDQTLGDLFVVRLAGNYAETGGIGSFEYAYDHFHSPLLIVLGHSGCGAIKATVDVMRKPGTVVPGDIAAIVNSLMPAVKAVQSRPGDIYANAIAENARLNAARLRSDPPILNKAAQAGTLRVISAVYDIASGHVSLV